jgi:outer membrane protein assembly factor BamB
MKGELAWSRFWEPVKTRYGWGLAASPVLHEDRLIIVNDNEDQSFITALDKQTGEEVWRVDRDEGSNWATPLVWNNDLRTEVVTPGTDRVRSYGLDGTLLWEFRGMSSITIPTPFSDSGLVFISSGYVGDELRPAYAVRLGASGDISLQENETSNEYIAWSLRQAGPYNPSPLVYGEYYYTLLDRGFMTCHKARTGELVYSKRRIERGSGAFTASPWAYDGKIFCLSEDGDTFVIKAGPEFELLGKNSLDEMSMATPALSQGSLIIRTASKLYRIARPPKSTVEHGTD